MSKSFSISFVLGVMCGLLVAGAWFVSTNPGVELFPKETRKSLERSGTVSASSLVVLKDQAAGESVVVDSVSVPAPGVWIAVRETSGTELRNVLGAARAGGPREKVAIALLRATLPGHSYAIELYRDDNGGTFEYGKNSVYIDFETGERVVVYFKTLP